MKRFTYFLLTATLLAISCIWSEVGAQTATLYDGTTTNQYHPFYGSYCDQYVRSQMIYPASELSSLSGKQLDGMTFYLKSAVSTWGVNFDVYLSEVTASNFNESTAWNDESVAKTLVYSGSLSGTSAEVPVTFNKSTYVYGGGNLMVEFKSTSKGSYPSTYFYGKSTSTNTSVYGKNASSTTFNANGRSKFLAKVTIAYSNASAGSSCAAPTDLTKGATTASSASFTWTAGGEETSWQYICLPVATEVDWTSEDVQTTESASATISELSENTPYKFYVRSYCGDGDGEQSSEISKAFTTPCEGVASLESYGFEDVPTGDGIYKIPDCWNKKASGNYPYVVDESSNAHGGDKYLCFVGGGSSSSSIIVLPPITDASALALSFWYKNNYESSNYGNLQIGYMTDPEDASTFNLLEGGTLEQVTSYTQVEGFPLSGVSSSYIAIRYSGGSSSFGRAYIDDIKVSAPLSCYKPASLNEATEITSEGATFAWSSSGHGESQYQYVCVPRYTTPDWTKGTIVNSTSVELSGLDANKNYTFYVRSYCGADDQSTALSKDFKTRCGTYDLPFQYGFEDLSLYGEPACWSLHVPSSYTIYTSTTNVHSGTKALYVVAGKTDANRSVVVLPQMDAALNKLGVSFYYYGTAGATIEVGYVTDAEDKSTFVKVGEAFTASTTYKQALVPFTSLGSVSGNIALCFKGATGDASFYIDDIRVARTVTISDNADNGSQISSLVAAGETTDVLMTRSLFKDGDYNPLCLPFSLSAAQLADAECPLNNFKLKVFDYIQNVNDEIVIYIAGASNIEAGVPYFVSYQGSPTSTTTQLLFRDVTFVTDEAGSKTCDNVTYQGTFSPTTLADQTGKTNPEILFLGADNTIYWPNANVNLKGFRAYFTADYGNLAPGRRVRGLRFAGAEENAATSVDALSNEENATSKRLENNQVVIIRDGVKYTVLGQPIR